MEKTAQHAHSSLMLAALGVVFGDIGTSPLYTLKECFGGSHAVPPTPENILGILSLVFWGVFMVISLKYVVFIMRADNKGEGGIMALLSLVTQKAKIDVRLQGVLMLMGLAGASLFYGDGIITPAISVLSAVEGLGVLHPELSPLVVPIALGVLIALFSIQKGGTSRVGALFGPVMLIWFLVLGGLGFRSLWEMPAVMAAVDPRHAFHFFMEHGWHGFLALGAVVLAVTGGEALYADMGHFGTGPIRKAWFFLVWPALLLNYFGQGALLLRNPEAVQNPFYMLVPAEAMPALIGLATLATVIASQAVISGSFSLTTQAIQLGFSPRLLVRFTSEDEKGQIYVPFINWALMFGIVALVLGFESSTRLAAAYGIAVTGTMAIDTILAFVVARCLWGWNAPLCILGAASLLVVDLSFLGANAMKIPDGGWFPLALGAIVFAILSTWKKGRSLLQQKLSQDALPMREFLDQIRTNPPHRVPGTAVFMTSNLEGAPQALLSNLEHNKILHETVIMITVSTENTPRVASDKRREVVALGDGFFKVRLRYGFMERPHIPRALKAIREFNFDTAEATFFFSRESLLPAPNRKMALWRMRLFIAMSRNMTSAAAYFRVPSVRVIELGTQVTL